ncbi:saccharopine dehydrogenase NADP-binding domain-containing protein [Bacteroides fragilis]|uniref:saccharopine dehydrogenase NADP-binding domain-containing protein n=1 Tax=Bacteroides fragilis TaxID=817 RepID=UPI00202F64AA|nr:saccharopine dehydrogenase NADP-binding domain-containing protein [Bacteroides fragilis]MCM0237087.1 saccharopine dehydrogenase NADP-binding domain-containing protein [Bacteroides fragilis]
MKNINEKLALLQGKIENNSPIVIMIIGLGSVGLYLLDYLLSLSDPQLRIVVVGRNSEKMLKDVNIVKTAATIRKQLQSKIFIESECDLDNIQATSGILSKHQPDFIINSSRVYSGLKYGSISWSKLRAYGVWTPLSMRYAKNIMEAYEQVDCDAITINTSYSDAVIPWLKSAGKSFFDFGSGNLNHLIPRMKFYIADKMCIDNLNNIDVTLAVSHFHDVVISKEGHAEGENILLDIRYQGEKCNYDTKDLLRSCMIPMPVDQKRNMMNASSNFDIIYSILDAIRNHKKIKLHSPGAQGEIGGYPYIIDGTKQKVTSYFDTTIFSMEEMRQINMKSIYFDGIENVVNGSLCYTKELAGKVKDTFSVDLPLVVNFEDIDPVSQLIVAKIIMPNL